MLMRDLDALNKEEPSVWFLANSQQPLKAQALMQLTLVAGHGCWHRGRVVTGCVLWSLTNPVSPRDNRSAEHMHSIDDASTATDARTRLISPLLWTKPGKS